VSPPGGCLFCRIAAGEEPAARVLEAPAVVAFLDHRPLFPGHCLVVPRRHVETIGELPTDLTAPLFDAVSRLARAVEAALAADGSFVAVNNRVSQSVPHLHVHVVPRRRGDGLRGFFWPRGHYANQEEMETTRRRIVDALVRFS
jgi:histidine triad (HIT) family protein